MTREGGVCQWNWTLSCDVEHDETDTKAEIEKRNRTLNTKSHQYRDRDPAVWYQDRSGLRTNISAAVYAPNPGRSRKVEEGWISIGQDQAGLGRSGQVQTSPRWAGQSQTSPGRFEQLRVGQD